MTNKRGCDREKGPFCLSCGFLLQDLDLDNPRKSSYRCVENVGVYRYIGRLYKGMSPKFRANWCPDAKGRPKPRGPRGPYRPRKVKG